MSYTKIIQKLAEKRNQFYNVELIKNGYKFNFDKNHIVKIGLKPEIVINPDSDNSFEKLTDIKISIDDHIIFFGELNNSIEPLIVKLVKKLESTKDIENRDRKTALIEHILSNNQGTKKIDFEPLTKQVAKLNGGTQFKIFDRVCGQLMDEIDSEDHSLEQLLELISAETKIAMNENHEENHD